MVLVLVCVMRRRMEQKTAYAFMNTFGRRSACETSHQHIGSAGRTGEQASGTRGAPAPSTLQQPIHLLRVQTLSDKRAEQKFAKSVCTAREMDGHRCATSE